MKNIELLNDTKLDLPINRGGNDYYEALQSTLTNFSKIVNTLDGELYEKLQPNLKIINTEIELILESTKLYYEGKTSRAYEKIRECLDLLEKNDLLETGKISGDFYRIRVAQNANLKRKDLFHIPFQIREKVATQRYSIPGLPCLYMADSIFIAWEEMGRPNIETIHVSRYNFEGVDMKLLYLNVTTNEMRSWYLRGDKINNINAWAKFLSYWPLLSACSFNTAKREEVFKPVYIVPQMVLQWIIEKQNIDGVQFKSNRMQISSHNIGSFNNIAIPVQTSKDNGFCSKLAEKIKLTSPLSWSLMDIADPNHGFKNKNANDISVEKIRTASYIELIQDEKTDYFTTKFGIMEEKLKIMDLNFIAGD